MQPVYKFLIRATDVRAHTLRTECYAPVAYIPPTVLVFDDSPIIREVVCRGLRFAGFAVVEAGNVDEALRLLRRGTELPAAIVSDVEMPGQSVRVLIERVRSVAAVLAARTGNWRWLLHPIHLLAAGSWIGTLAAMFLLFGCQRPRTGAESSFIAETSRRFSPLAMTSTAILAVTGLLSASRKITAMSDVLATNYGEVLALKLLFVAAAAGCGAWNWRTLRSSLEMHGDTRPWRTAAVELSASAIVVLAAAVLVSMRAQS